MKLISKTELIDIEKRCKLSVANTAYTNSIVSLNADIVLKIIKELRRRRYQMSQQGVKKDVQ